MVIRSHIEDHCTPQCPAQRSSSSSFLTLPFVIQAYRSSRQPAGNLSPVSRSSAIDRARHASLKRFLAYHDHREKECDFEGNVGANENKLLGATQWATVAPIFEGKAPRMNASAILKESIKLNKPPMRVRKPIPTWF